MNEHRVLHASIFVALLLLTAAPAAAQLTASDIESLRAQGAREGWTFTVGESEATAYALSDLCGLVVPENWGARARFDPCPPRRSLPPAYDWRELGGCTPIRNQGGCGSCWAFATLGPLESNILLKDHLEVDLSEQWLLSCNHDGWSCSGGWWAHDYLDWNWDSCGGTGAVLETEFPYRASDHFCDCPFKHLYRITTWNFIGSEEGVPPVGSIKQAILDYGPVSVAVHTNSAFHAYSGGIFNGCAEGVINHAVVLVGWNDAEGVWIMRNSWGESWGEDGYMRIPYDCSFIGYSACYLLYQQADCNDNGIPDKCDIECGASGDFCDVAGCGGSLDCNNDWVPDECQTDCNGNGIPDDCDLAAGTSPDCNGNEIPDECDPDCDGNGHPDDCDLAAGGIDCNWNHRLDACELADGSAFDCNDNGQLDECDLYPPEFVPPHDSCADAEIVCPNILYPGTTSAAESDGAASCGESAGAGDVWYYYRAGGNGFLQVSATGIGFDLVLSLHSGCPGTVENQVACSTGVDGPATITRATYMNQEFWIRVAGVSGATGDYHFGLAGPTCVYTGECNDNGIPDECEVDCNLNGQPDDCDLADGTSLDVDGDGIPDECQGAGRGDLNCDGAIDVFDIDPFVLALTDPASYAASHAPCSVSNADVNADGVVDAFDIDAFVALLTSR